MSSPLIFVRDERTLPYIPVTVAALQAIRAAAEPKRRPYAVATYMALLELANEDRSNRVAVTQRLLMDRIGSATSTIRMAVGTLQEAGVLRVVEKHHSGGRLENEYVVVEPPERGTTESTLRRSTADPPPHDGERSLEVQQEEPLPLSENGSEVGPEKTSAVYLDEQLVARDGNLAEIVRGEIVEAESPPPLRFNGRPVPPSLAADALSALAYFNEQTGQTLKPTTASGKPTEGLSRILGAMTEHPEVRIVYRRMIDHNLMAPWWQGEPSPNVIFGPNIVQQSIQRAERRPLPGANVRLTPSGQALRALRLAAELG